MFEKILKMKAVVYLTLILGFLLIILIITDKGSDGSTTKMCFKENNCFNVWIADSDFEKQKGLMYVENLNENQGMLFVFDNEGNYTFWMKNTLIPLDMIWLNKNFEVVHISNAIPCSSENCTIYYSNEPAQYVLEILSDTKKSKLINKLDKLSLSNNI